jgi:hypothetical protein
MQFIGITGKKQVGKDTFADALESKGHKVLRFSFAKPMYDMLEVAFGPLPRLENGDYDKDAPIPTAGGRTLRYLLQTLGTEWGRTLVNTGVWVSIVKQRMALIGDATADYIVFTDIRYANEAEYVRSLGGQVIEIRRDGAPGGDTHTSESGIPAQLVGTVLHNNGSLSSYQSAIARMLKKLKGE